MCHILDAGHYEGALTVETRPTLPDWVAFTGVPVPAGFTDAVALRMVELATFPWEESFGWAVRFSEEHSHLAPAGPQHDQLNSWLGMQRVFYRRGDLSAERTARLESIGMVWKPDRQRFEEAVAAVTALGTLRVPKDAMNGNPSRSLHD